ncbi:MAG: asparagine synthase (glutamine-hydrolyzing) [Planctomycetota bacterium]
MCGIAGVLGGGPPEALGRMLEALAPRGPDDEGRFDGPGVSLGMRRLVVIDREGGRQPMADDEGRFRIVYNGEVYNFADLQSGLEGQGVRFRTRSDTEAVLLTLARDGVAGLARLRGMFALALHDARDGSVLLARDRLGKKPLFLLSRGHRLAFASELKAILSLPDFTPRIDPVSLEAYLAFGYVPGERTILEGVRRLPPGGYLRWRPDGIETGTYWRLPDPDPDATADPERIAEILDEAVRLRLVSDVPLGIFLSAGIDSAAILAAARKAHAGTIRTYTIGYADADEAWSETAGAKRTAAIFGAESRVAILSADVEPFIAPLAAALDEPFSDVSALPTWLLAGAARREITVALSGIGGDELFAGYPRHLGARFAGLYGILPRFVRRLLARLPFRESRRKRDLGSWAHRFFSNPDAGFPDRYIGWIEILDAADRAAVRGFPLPPGGAAEALAFHRAAFGNPAQAPVDGALRTDLCAYLPDNLLAFGDRVTMNWGLEMRAPLCDQVLLEAAARLPGRVRTRGWRLKPVLKAALQSRLPGEILHRPKQGFQVPLGPWLDRRRGGWVRRLLDPAALSRAGELDPAGVTRILDEHESGRRNRADAIWGLAILEAWRRIFIERDPEWVQRSRERPKPPELQ